MKSIFYKKMVLFFLGISLLLNPLLAVASQIETENAEDPYNNITDAATTLIDINEQSSYKYAVQKPSDLEAYQPTAVSSAYQSLLITMAKFSGDGFLDFDDLFISGQEPKLIIKQNDLSAIKSMHCLSNILPKFDDDLDALYANLPKDKKEIIDKEASNRRKTPAGYLASLRTGADGDTSTSKIEEINRFNELIRAAYKNVGDEKIRKNWLEEIENLKKGDPPSVDVNTLACVTGFESERVVGLINSDKPYLADKIEESIDSLDIDVRILKTLVYLITPKNQGGAGHWRVRVQRIFQHKEESTESDAILQTLSNTKPSAECSEEMTAADCGKQQGTTPDLEIEDKDGTEYDAYLKSLSEAEDKTIEERGLSAHAEGQAIDISEIDDIRCTKVVKKNTGGTKKYKQPVRPIKLAWQTTDGWNASNGSDSFDMMSLLKSTASESIQDLLGGLNSDITDYEGDLSQADFDDIVQVLGQSLLSNLLNAKSFNLEGFNVEDTLKKLGSTYVADYLGLPREIFAGENIASIENVKYIIGRSAIEKKLGLPFNSLSGNNLPEILLTVGQRKIEHEMSLNPGDLNQLFQIKNEISADYVGRKVLEKELTLPKSSWPEEPVNFGDLSKHINPLRLTLIKNNPGMIDNSLNLGAGTTDDLVHGRINSSGFARIAGQKRLEDTLYGLKYFSVNNSAYQLPGPTAEHPEIKNTWEGALNGDPDSLTTIGIYTIARLLADDSLTPNVGEGTKYEKIRVSENGIPLDIDRGDFGRFVFRQWLRSNLSKSGNECAISKPNRTIDYDVTDDGQIIFSGSSKVSNSLPALPIVQSVDYALLSGSQSTDYSDEFVISEDQAAAAGLGRLDLQRIFGCATTSSKAVFKRIGSTMLYTGIANKLLSKEEKARIDLLNTNPELKITNNAIAFYVTRANKMKDLTAEIKNSWQSFVKDKPNLDSTSAGINDILNDLTGIYETADSALIKTEKIRQALSSLASQIDSLQTKIEAIKGFYEAKSVVNEKITALNNILINSNELVHTASEIISGKEIPTSDYLKLPQINTIPLADEMNSGDSHNDKINTPFKTSSLIFGFLAGSISPDELFKRFGANITESKLGLPSNTLTYLVDNYEKKGLGGSESLFYALGQAKIEETFSMPANYFQAENTLPSMPDFEKNVSSLLQYGDRSKIDGSISKYLSSAEAGKVSSVLGALPKSIAEIRSEAEYKDILAKMHMDEWVGNSEIVASAKKNWQAKQEEKINQLGSSNAKSQTLDDVVKNISKRGLNGVLKSAEKDLLMRLGFGGENYDALKSGGVLAWQKAASNASSVDAKLNIGSGATKSLFTEERGMYAADLSSNEKNLLESSLKISKDVLGIYIKLINGKISANELGQYNQQSPDYVFSNPYADEAKATEGKCPVSFTLKEGFSVNESSLENNTFCHYDKDGRHCFRSPEEAQRYAVVHSDRKYGDILDQVAARLSESITDNSSPTAIRKNLLNFINNKKTKYAFNSDRSKNEQILKNIAGKSGVDLSTLKKLFTRDDTITILNYQLSIGREAAKKLITYKLFDNLGLDVDSSLFGPDDLYDVLNGDLTSLYRVGTHFIDRELNLKPGTVLSVFNAKDQLSRDCSLDQIGGSIIANLVGIDYFPLKGKNIGDFLSNFGESKVEQSLNLPQGTFFGKSFDEAMERSRAINIALAFKLPLANSRGEGIIDNNSLSDILGENYAKRIKDTSQAFKAEQIQSQIRSALVINNSALAAMAKIDLRIKSQLSNALSQIASGKQLSSDLTVFYEHITHLDRLFSIQANSTYDLLAGKNNITPDRYNELVATEMGMSLAASKIGQSLGLDQSQSELAGNLIRNVGNIFRCQGNLVEVDGRKICRTGGKEDEWFHQWSKLYDYLDQIFTFQLDGMANLPEGTIQRIIENPGSTGPILMEIGAQKIDTQFGLDSTKVSSFAGLFSRVSTPGGQAEDCLTKAQSDETVIPLDIALHDAETALSQVKKEKPALLSDVSSSAYKQWQDKYKSALDEYEQAKSSLSKEINNRYAACKVASAQDSSGMVDGTFRDNIVAWAQDALSETIHNYIFKLSAKYNGDLARIGVNMPVEDLEKMIRGDMRYFEMAVLSLGVNYVTVSVDKIRNNHCGSDEEECDTAVPEAMRISYEDMKTSVFGPEAADAYKRAAWIDINGAQTDPNVVRVCDGKDCPQTGSGNFGDVLIDSLGKPAENSAAGDTVLSRADEQSGYSEEKYQARIADLKSNGDPEGQLDRLSNPQKYYKTDGGNFTPKNGETIMIVQKSIKKASQENLQNKMLDMALWKLDENVYPGMARDLLKGNPEVKTAALARYLKTGLANGHLFGVQFNAVQNIDKWAQVASFARDYMAGDSNAFTKFASGDGFNFFSNYIAKGSQNWLGFEISTDLAKAFLVGIGTGDWGLKSISLDNIAKSETTTHKIVSNGKEIELPTVGGIATTVITEKLFSWADKALGLEKGQSFKLFKMGHDIYKSWKVYDELSKVKDLSDISPAVRQFLEARKITDLKKAQEAAKAFYSQAASLFAYEVTAILTDKLLGNQITGVEEGLGMAPGTLAPLVSTMIYNYAVVPAVNAVAGTQLISATNPAIAVAVAVIGYLLGQKVYYYCTADGYFPKIEDPAPSIKDETGLGVWGGRIKASTDISGLMQRKAIESSQNKARKLIQNLLWVQNNRKFNSQEGEPLVPIQIMTARREDVEYFDQIGSISSKMCQARLGEDSISCGGICGSASKKGCTGDTRMGIWQNPQTIAWTHIGF